MLSFICVLYNYPFFFFNDTATTEIYTLSLHDALPILRRLGGRGRRQLGPAESLATLGGEPPGSKDRDRKSTRLNSSHGYISYAVFCLKKKKRIESIVAMMNAKTRYIASMLP